ncbi:MAG TPA: ATP-binding protein [Terriglobia bacterium]|nr:ATP-binding protein [Terriglobia bacterium]
MPSSASSTHSLASRQPLLSAEFLATVLREITQAVLVVDGQGHPMLWNRAMEELCGVDSARALTTAASDLLGGRLAEEILAAAEKARAQGQLQRLVLDWPTGAKTTIPVEMCALPIRSPEGEPLALLTFHNLSEQQRLEEELRQSQKMEAIGKLAGGIAHDFNNVLTTILTLSEAMIQGQTPPNAESLKEIRHAAKHAAELTHHLLAFSRRQILQMRTLRLEEVVRNLSRMLSRVIGEDIRLEILCHPPLPAIRGDQSQIEQVLLNLCLNARDAMPEGGELRIELRAETLTPAWCAAHKGARPGSYVLLTVRDTGVGMDEKTLARIFEPFFTLKGLGKGTGLGLAMVYGIVKQHDGFLQVSSQPGAGTEFGVYFPISKAEPEPVRPAETVGPAPLAPGSATILVVEDEKSVRKLVLELLPKLGYKVIAAADGEEAIKVFERWGNQIDLVLLDAILPKYGGRQVYEEIRKRKPSVRFVFTSGYNEEFINRKFELDPSFLFLRKPFSTKELAAILQRALQS